MASDIFIDVVKKANEDKVHAICVLKGKNKILKIWVSIYSKLSWHWIFLGGYRFFSDLLNKINALNTSTMAGASPGEVGKSVQVKIEFIRVKSYLNDK